MRERAQFGPVQNVRCAAHRLKGHCVCDEFAPVVRVVVDATEQSAGLDECVARFGDHVAVRFVAEANEIGDEVENEQAVATGVEQVVIRPRPRAVDGAAPAPSISMTASLRMPKAWSAAVRAVSSPHSDKVQEALWDGSGPSCPSDCIAGSGWRKRTVACRSLHGRPVRSTSTACERSR